MPKKNVVMTVKESDLSKMLIEYSELSKQIKLLDERKKSLGDTIKCYAMDNGSKDDKGSFYCEKDNFTFGAQCKKSVSLNEDKAMEFLESKGFTECIKMVAKVDEEALEKRCSTGDITPEELESITTSRVSYAVTVKSIGEMPEVQQTEVVAASRKPTRKLLRK